MLQHGVSQLCVRWQCGVLSPPACYVFFVPEEGRLSLGSPAAMQESLPGSGFPRWKEAPLRAGEAQTLVPSPEDGELCCRARAALGSLGLCSSRGALPLPRPGLPPKGSGAKASLRGVPKVCQSPMESLKSFLSPAGAPAEISHRAVF